MGLATVMVLLPTIRKRARPTPRSPRVGQERGEIENLPLAYQSKQVDSKEEGRVIVALGIMKWGFGYKVSYFGGRSTPGGVEVDFLVDTPVLLTPLRLQSRYYHLIRRDGTKDVFDYAKLIRIPGLAAPVDIWDYQTQSVEQAVRELTVLIGRPG